VSNSAPSTDKVKSCLCNVESYTKVGEGWYAEAYVIDDVNFKPSTTCKKLKSRTSSSQSASKASFKYLVKVEHLTRGNIVPFANLHELTKTISNRYETLELAKKAGKLGVGPKVFDGYECKVGKNVYFITVMEYLEGETYLNFFKSHKNNKEILEQIVQDISSKVKKLNDNNILHKDVHGENIIVMKKGDKHISFIIDYGNAVYAQDKNLPTVDDPKDPNNVMDSNAALIDKLIFKLLDDKVIYLNKKID
jgi:serine/threonine protein kinase